METGLSVKLDPLGGNQLNVRELLRLLTPVPAVAPDDADDAGMEDGAAAGGTTADREPEQVGRRSALDDYDYDDDFIDDADLVEEEDNEQPQDGEYDESADDDYRMEDQVVSESEDDKPEGAAPIAHGKGVITTDVQHHGFGNVNLDHLRLPSQQVTPKKVETDVSPKDAKGATKGENKDDNASKVGSKADASVPPQVKKKAAVEGGANVQSQVGAVRMSNVKLKPVPASLLEEISKLEHICRETFGDKKPKLQDPKVQDQLHVIFKKAMEANVARLFSDIAKDRRIVALNDEVWVRLSRFLRTKRANLEQLGHALHWSAKEKSAKDLVEQREMALDELLKQQLQEAPTNAVEGSARSVQWTRVLDERLYDWYRSRCDLQMAKNQLASRAKSVKKSIPAWVSTLKSKCFVGFTVGEQDIVDSFRRIEEERQAQERQKRDADRLERKRRKEEQAAAVAAKRAATVQTKGIAAQNSVSPSTPLSADTSAHEHVAQGGVKVGKNVAKQSNNGKSMLPKMSTPKPTKTSASTNNGTSPNIQKQAKLTSLIKKPAKSDSAGGQGGKANASTTNVTPKPATIKSGKSGTAGKAASAKGTPGKGTSAKAVLLKTPTNKSGSGNAPSKSTSAKADSEAKVMAAKANVTRPSAKPTSGKIAQKKNTPSKLTPVKVSSGKASSVKPVLGKTVPKKLTPTKAKPPKITPGQATALAGAACKITQQRGNGNMSSSNNNDTGNVVSRTGIVAGAGSKTPTLQEPSSVCGGENKNEEICVVQQLPTPPVGPGASVLPDLSRPESDQINSVSPTNQVASTTTSGAAAAAAAVAVSTPSSTGGNNQATSALPNSNSRNQFEVIELD